MDGEQKIIEGVVSRNLSKIENDKGSILHVIKSTDPHFNKFGECYISEVNLEK